MLFYIYDDEKKHIFEYRSTPNFDMAAVKSMLDKQQTIFKGSTMKLTKYSNEDYEFLT